MKKLLGVSIATMLAVSPMLAHAAGEVYATSGSPASATSTAGTAENITTSATAPYASVDAQKTNTIATTSYVKGAYNAAIQAVNKVAADAASAGTAAGNVDVVTSSTSAGGVTFTDSAGTTHEVVIKDIEAGNIANDAVETAAIKDANVTKAKLAADVQTSLGLADTALQAADLADYATKLGVVATINNSTASGTLTVYNTWGDETQTGQGSVTISSDVTSPATNAYYETLAAQSGTTQTDPVAQP